MLEREYDDYERRANLDALRHLPPGTSLPQPATSEEQMLLADLVGLTATVDPLVWLRNERATLCARITLYELVTSVKRFIGTAWVDSPDDRTVIREVDALLEPPEHRLAIARLRRAVERLRPLQHLPPAIVAYATPHPRQVPDHLKHVVPPAPVDPLSPRDHLLLDLLALPPSVDPLHWLQTEHTAYVISTAFSTILQQVVPRRKIVIEHTIGQAIGPLEIGETRRQASLQVTLDEILLGTEGFALTAFVQIAVPPTWPAVAWVWPDWSGFDRVVDNQGYAYLALATERAGRSVRDRLPIVFDNARIGRLHMVFYPAISSGASDLTFTSSLTTLLALGVIRSDTGPLPATAVEPLTWRVALPRTL